VIGTLIGVKFRTLKGALRSEQDGKFRIPAFAALSLVFWAMLFRSSHWVVTEALKIEPVGELLIQRLLSISFLIFLGLLVFSNIVTVFSTFYLADELEFLMTKPIPKDMFFSARFVESLAQSSWVIFIFGLPIFIAAGVGIGAGPMYFLGLIGVLIPFVAIPTVIATLIGLLVTNILAANRTRDATLFLGLAAFSVIFIVIRALRPERLLNPDSFSSIGEMLNLLAAPTTVYLPSDWAMNVIVPLLYGRSEVDFWSLGLLYLTPLAFFFVSAWAHRRFYYRGFSKAQEGRHGQSLVTVLRDRMLKRTYSRSRTLDERIDELSKSGRVGNPLREMVRKDQLVFVRDASQWSQILIVIAIVVIYLVNYKYFEIAADERLLGDVGLFFFNLAACGFVVVALSGRFLFPGVSLEGRSFWLIMQAPVSLDRFLVGKWLGGILPVLIVGQALIWSSNLLVFQNIVYAISASIIIFSITLGVSAMAVGLGAVYPQFYNPNAAKIASSFGAVIYMILGMFLVLFVLIATFRATLYWGSIAGGKPPGEIAWNSYLGVFLGLVAPAAAGWFSIRLGAAALRRRM
jgi:ABC-2 type transport system permease protein